MALNIPMPDLPGNALLKGLQTGGDLYSKYMQPIIQREQISQQQRDLAERGQYHQGALKQQETQLAQQWKQHLQDLALRQQTENRIGALAPLQRQQLQFALQKAEREADPQKQLQYYNAIRSGLSQMNGQQGQEQVQQGMGPFQGQGMIRDNALQPPSQQQIQQGFKEQQLSQQSPAEADQLAYQLTFGKNMPKPYQSPEQKQQQALDLFRKEEEIKYGNKSKAIKEKEIAAVNKDLPTLEKSLKGVDELLRIAKNNPDMFGHTFMPDRFAKTTKIKDFGKWQTHIADAISGLEGKLSSKGNIVALKMAAQLKPSHAEQQDVAIGKLESMREQLVESINNSRGITGKAPLKSEKNPIDLSKMSDEELQKIISGGQ